MTDRAGQGQVVRRRLAIKNKLGLHARAATVLITTIRNFDAAVRVTKDDQEVDGTSILGLLMLDAAPGSEVDVEVSGPQAEEALEAIAVLFEDGFGEEC
jgi:phosphocarrier protein